MQRLSLFLGLEILLAIIAIALSALPWPLKILACAALLILSRVPQTAKPSSPTVMSSWGIFYQGIAHFPHQSQTKTDYHALLLRLKFNDKKASVIRVQYSSKL